MVILILPYSSHPVNGELEERETYFSGVQRSSGLKITRSAAASFQSCLPEDDTVWPDLQSFFKKLHQCQMTGAHKGGDSQRKGSFKPDDSAGGGGDRALLLLLL